MTNPNHSHITIVVDRSGSMASIREEAESAVNAFIHEQAVQPGTCSVLLIDFDGVDPSHVFYDGDAKDFDTPYMLIPRGMTPLLDAIGMAITATGKRLMDMPVDERPGHVFCVVATDGAENASHDYSVETIRDMIKEHEDVYAWTFVFLAAGPGAWANREMFVGTQMHTNSMRSAAGGQAYVGTYAVASANVANTRAGGQSVFGGTVNDAGEWTPDEPNAK